MSITCFPARLCGTVAAIPSKSDAHRKLILTALSDNGGVLPLSEPLCEDLSATVACLEALGAGFSHQSGGLAVTPIRPVSDAELPCGESGSTLRFLLPVAMCVCPRVSMSGKGRLPQRPIGALTAEMARHGVTFESETLPLSASGTLRGGEYAIAGNISSQFLSGLLMALPLCGSDSVISLTTPLESAPYVEMTLSALRLFGISVTCRTGKNALPRFFVKGGQRPHAPETIPVEGDWSNAAFFLAAGALSPSPGIRVTGLSEDSAQGDRQILKILSGAGAAVERSELGIAVSGGKLSAVDADMREIPDLLPILAVVAAFCEGESHFRNAARLRLKESDRLSAVSGMLRALGGDVTEEPDALIVRGTALRGGETDAKNDHRLVMAAAVAAAFGSAPVTIQGARAVRKSYPGFFTDYESLGGKTSGIELW